MVALDMWEKLVSHRYSVARGAPLGRGPGEVVPYLVAGDSVVCVCVQSCISIPLHAARRAMAAAKGDSVVCRDPADGDVVVSCEDSATDLHSGVGEALAGPIVSVLSLSMAAVESTNTVYRWPLS